MSIEMLDIIHLTENRTLLKEYLMQMGIPEKLLNQAAIGEYIIEFLKHNKDNKTIKISNNAIDNQTKKADSKVFISVDELGNITLIDDTVNAKITGNTIDSQIYEIKKGFPCTYIINEYGAVTEVKKPNKRMERTLDEFGLPQISIKHITNERNLEAKSNEEIISEEENKMDDGNPLCISENVSIFFGNYDEMIKNYPALQKWYESRYGITKGNEKIISAYTLKISEDNQKIEEQKNDIDKLQNMLGRSLSFVKRVRESRVGKFFFRKDLNAIDCVNDDNAR